MSAHDKMKANQMNSMKTNYTKSYTQNMNIIQENNLTFNIDTDKYLNILPKI